MVRWQSVDANYHDGVSSVSNGSVLPGFGPGWDRMDGPSPGQEPPSNPTLFVLAGLLPGPQIHCTVPLTLTPNKYMSSDRIVTWSVHKLCSFSPSFTSRIQVCDRTDIRWVAVK